MVKPIIHAYGLWTLETDIGYFKNKIYWNDRNG